MRHFAVPELNGTAPLRHAAEFFAGTRRLANRVKEDFDALQSNTRLSRSDRDRLDHFVTLIRDVQTRIDSVPVISCDGPLQRMEETHDQAYSNHIDIMIAALACGITKIGTMYCYHHASDGNDRGLHDVSHADGPEAISRSLEYNTWIANRFAEILTDTIIAGFRNASPKGTES